MRLAEQLNIKSNTAYAIIRRARLRDGVVAVPRGGRTHHKIDDEIGNACAAIVEEKPAFTLRQINQELRHRLPNKPHLSVTSLARCLKGRLIVLKKLEDSPIERNSDRVKTQRHDYAQWLMQDGLHNELVFIDESGINLWTRRTRGRAVVGSRAVRTVAGRRGKNFTVVFAVSNTRGLLHHDILEGGMTGDRFRQFLETVSEAHENSIRFIFDNASCHSVAGRSPAEGGPNLRSVHECIFLPPYSPFLNIVENAFSAFKWSLKNLLEEVRHQLPNESHESRMATLVQLAEQSVEVITPQKSISWFNHAQSYVPACIEQSDILM